MASSTTDKGKATDGRGGDAGTDTAGAAEAEGAGAPLKPGDGVDPTTGANLAGTATPEPARFVRPSDVLAANVALTNPETGKAEEFAAGTTPPQWAIDLITNPGAWEQVEVTDETPIPGPSQTFVHEVIEYEE